MKIFSSSCTCASLKKNLVDIKWGEQRNISAKLEMKDIFRKQKVNAEEKKVRINGKKVKV